MVIVLGAEMHRAACTGRGSSSVDSAGEPTGPNDPVFQGVARSSVTSFRVRHPSNQGVVEAGRRVGCCLFLPERIERKKKIKW